jgi:hypothetical protein
MWRRRFVFTQLPARRLCYPPAPRFVSIAVRFTLRARPGPGYLRTIALDSSGPVQSGGAVLPIRSASRTGVMGS